MTAEPLCRRATCRSAILAAAGQTRSLRRRCAAGGTCRSAIPPQPLPAQSPILTDPLLLWLPAPCQHDHDRQLLVGRSKCTTHRRNSTRDGWSTRLAAPSAAW
jgi:hypothetical protein